MKKLSIKSFGKKSAPGRPIATRVSSSAAFKNRRDSGTRPSQKCIKTTPIQGEVWYKNRVARAKTMYSNEGRRAMAMASAPLLPLRRVELLAATACAGTYY